MLMKARPGLFFKSALIVALIIIFPDLIVLLAILVLPASDMSGDDAGGSGSIPS
jgi:hypothetical protein